MDLILQGKKPELNMPYFGRQSRFFEFFYKVVSELYPSGATYAETNSGSVSNAYMFAKIGYKVIINDISPYSEAIALSVMGDIKNKNDSSSKIKKQPSWIKNILNNPIDRAAFFASLIHYNGYSKLKIPSSFASISNVFKRYRKHLLQLRSKKIRAESIFCMDLFDYLDFLFKKKIKVDIMFMDFAWPWRNGSKTGEYDITSNYFSKIMGRYSKTDIWDKDNVIKNVLKAIRLAKKVSKIVLLSNQSSNYPDPETLELALIGANLMYEKRHTMTTLATNEDNLCKEKYFREYLYVIKGKK